MKKSALFFIVAFFAISATSQEYFRVECSWVASLNGEKHCEVLLSDGSQLCYVPSESSYYCYSPTGSGKKIVAYLPTGRRVPVGDFIRRNGVVYCHEQSEDLGIVTIKKVGKHQVSIQNETHIEGSFSYESFLKFFGSIGGPIGHSTILGGTNGGGKGRADGSFYGNSRGGTKTIVNVYFTNGKRLTVDAFYDPTWLDADCGMKAKCTKVGNFYLYELII